MPLRIPSEVRTQRLLLRQWRESDLDAFCRVTSDPEAMRFLGDGKASDRFDTWRSMAAHLGHWALRGYGLWAVELLETGEWIGRVGPWYPEGWPELEVGWVIDPRHQRRGYATEAARAALDVCFEQLEADRIISLIRPENAASIRVADKLGGKPEGQGTGSHSHCMVYAHYP